MSDKHSASANSNQPTIRRYPIFLLSLIASTDVLYRLGGLPPLRPAWLLEMPLLLYLYWLMNRLLRPGRLQPWLAALPIVLVYHIFDIYHMQFGRLLRVAEVTELPEMFLVLSTTQTVICGLAVGLPLLLILAFINWRRIGSTAVASLPALALLATVVFSPKHFIVGFDAMPKDLIFYSDVLSAGYNGRLAMTLYSEAKRRNSIEKTTQYLGDSPYLNKFSRTSKQVADEHKKRNVHMVVLESFIDPSLLKKARFTKNPAHPDFVKLLGDNGSLSVSPVFGGSTAQAEFEVLCGVPALHELSGIEFDVFTGAKTLCLPQILQEGGYQTLATNAFMPDFFNSTNAYAGMGFSDAFFPKEYAPARDTYLTSGDVSAELYMFDGDLLRQNLAFVASKIAEKRNQPIFNYVISMYGHLPHVLDAAKRPTVTTLEGEFQDDQLERSVNQYYYRTQALAAYVKELIRIDPKSLIVLVSDHLPPLAHGQDTYRTLNYLGGIDNDIYLNRVYFIENGKPVRYPRMHHYDMPQVILNYVTRGDYCKEEYCGFKGGPVEGGKMAYREEYMTIMARAMF